MAELTTSEKATKKADALIKLRDRLKDKKLEQDNWRNLKSKLQRMGGVVDDEIVVEKMKETVGPDLLKEAVLFFTEKVITQMDEIQANIEIEIKRELGEKI